MSSPSLAIFPFSPAETHCFDCCLFSLECLSTSHQQLWIKVETRTDCDQKVTKRATGWITVNKYCRYFWDTIFNTKLKPRQQNIIINYFTKAILLRYYQHHRSLWRWRLKCYFTVAFSLSVVKVIKPNLAGHIVIKRIVLIESFYFNTEQWNRFAAHFWKDFLTRNVFNMDCHQDSKYPYF